MTGKTKVKRDLNAFELAKAEIWGNYLFSAPGFRRGDGLRNLLRVHGSSFSDKPVFKKTLAEIQGGYRVMAQGPVLNHQGVVSALQLRKNKDLGF